MTKILDEVLAANTKYTESFGDKGNLPLPPSRHSRKAAGHPDACRRAADCTSHPSCAR
jgi:hypothetical protein